MDNFLKLVSTRPTGSHYAAHFITRSTHDVSRRLPNGDGLVCACLMNRFIWNGIKSLSMAIPPRCDLNEAIEPLPNHESLSCRYVSLIIGLAGKDEDGAGWAGW